MQKGKIHGVIDIGLSVLAFKRHRHRVDIDAEELIYHLKVIVHPYLPSQGHSASLSTISRS
jgi:hypothetical protein